MLMIAGRRGDDGDNGQVLRNVKVKQRSYSRWKPVTSECIAMVMRAFQAAIRFVYSHIYRLG